MTLTKIKGTSLLLDGYITRGNPIQRVYNGITYHIIHYQGEHANEFAIYETKNGIYDGRAELYKDGMLKIRWEMKNGKRDGLYVQYKKGIVVKKGRWKDVGIDAVEERWVENKPGSIRMIISSFGSVVYRGGFDDKLDKSGYGMEFNRDGSPSRSGLYQNDKLVCLLQRVDSPSEMIEFAKKPPCNSELENDDCVFMHPTYTGSFLFDEETNTLQRNGTGYLIDSESGYCIAKSEWEKGIEDESKRVPLYDGWYCWIESFPPLRFVAEMEESAPSSPPVLHCFNCSSRSYSQTSDEPITKNQPELDATYRPSLVSLPRPTSRPFSVPSNPCPPSTVHYPPSPELSEEQIAAIYKPYQRTPQLPPLLRVPKTTSRPQPTPVHPSAAGGGRTLEPFTDFDPLPGPMESIEPEKEKPKPKASTAEPFVLPSVLIPNLSTIQTMVMPANSFSKQTYTLIQMSDIPTLKQITIGDDSFANVRTFSITNLEALKSVTIGKRCCTLSKQSPVQECVEGRFSIANCPNLTTLSIGSLSFSDYHFLDLTDLPALNSLSIAAVCFKYGTYFKLECTHLLPLLPSSPATPQDPAWQLRLPVLSAGGSGR